MGGSTPSSACRTVPGHRGVAHRNCPTDWQDETSGTKSSLDVKGHTSVAWTPPIVVPLAQSLDAAATLLNAGKKTVISHGMMRGNAG